MTIALEWGLAGILQTILAVPESELDLGVTDLYGDTVAQIAVESNEGRVETSHWFRYIEILRYHWLEPLSYYASLEVSDQAT